MTENSVIAITCMRCGAKVKDVDAAREHSSLCRPRRWYWWPREHPYVFALFTFFAGLAIGWLAS